MNKGKGFTALEIKISNRGGWVNKRFVTAGFTLIELSGSNSHYRLVDVDTDTGTDKGEKASKSSYLSVESETMGHFLLDVHRR